MAFVRLKSTISTDFIVNVEEIKCSDKACEAYKACDGVKNIS